MPTRITTYEQAFEDVLSITYGERAKEFVRRMEAKGHNEKGICFAIWKTQDKLLRFVSDPRLFSVMENEIKKWSWPKGDPRWDKSSGRTQA